MKCSEELLALIAKAKEVTKSSDEELSELLGISRSAISKWKAGVCLPRPKQIKNLQKFADGVVIRQREIMLEEVNKLLEQASIVNQCKDERIAHLLGVSRSSITKWKNGETGPSPRNLRRLKELAQNPSPFSGVASATLAITERGMAALIHYVKNASQEPDLEFCIELLRRYQ